MSSSPSVTRRPIRRSLVGLRQPASLAFLAFATACATGTAEREDVEPSSQETPGPGGAPGPMGPPPVLTSTQTEVPPPGEAPAGSPVAVNGQLRIEGGRLVNEAGDAIQLEGVSTMWLNWESGFSQNEQGLVWMRDSWNIEVVRAAMGVEPEGAYLAAPQVALQRVETVIRNAIVAGVYVIIDWHDHEAHSHQEDAQNFFATMAETWGEYPNVLYEIFNEPMPPTGTWANIKPYHEAVLGTIRAIDPDGIVIMGTPNWSQRPDEAADDPVAGDNLMYTLHFYACDHGESIRNYGQDALDKGHAVFVTEWGATTADGGLPSTGAMLCLEEAQAWHDWMAAEGISWTAWKLDACADASCFFAPGAPFTGGWTAENLQGHGSFVVDRLAD